MDEFDKWLNETGNSKIGDFTKECMRMSWNACSVVSQKKLNELEERIMLLNSTLNQVT